MATCANFNSIKVRLEPTTQNGGAPVPTFQFHKGAIRTNFPPLASHKYMNFNSIKVRLERQLIIEAARRFLNFNSIKVRLEQHRQRCYPAKRQFQFHKGAIRTQI